MRAPLVAVTDSPAGADLSVERAVLAGLRVEAVPVSSGPALIAALQDAEAILCMHTRLAAPVIAALRRCRVIVRFGTGLDNIDQVAAAQAGIAVVGVHDYCTEEVANHTLALLLAWNRKILAYHNFVAAGRWNERPQTTGNWGCGPVGRLSGQTLGLAGLGRIGQAVAARARALGLRVLGYSRHADGARSAAQGIEAVSRDDLLARADFLSLHLPWTPETDRFIRPETIRRMKPSAVLINTARGGLIDEDALVAALREGRLGGALLDVYAHAPLSLDHPLRGLPNVILTPHVAFYSEESLRDLRRLAAEAVLAHLTTPSAERT